MNGLQKPCHSNTKPSPVNTRIATTPATMHDASTPPRGLAQKSPHCSKPISHSDKSCGKLQWPRPIFWLQLFVPEWTQYQLISGGGSPLPSLDAILYVIVDVVHNVILGAGRLGNINLLLYHSMCPFFWGRPLANLGTLEKSKLLKWNIRSKYCKVMAGLPN